jgi:predicted nuclease of predicted toxin-antitoxin system
MARLLADENFDFPVVEGLRRLGHDVLTSQDVGLGGRPDADVLAFAIAQRRGLLTFDRRDYIRLHNQVRPHYGIIVCTRDNDFGAQANRIHQALANCPTLDNQLIRIVRPQTP